MKISESRRSILERMAAGEEIWTLSGLNPHAFWHHSISDRSPRIDTVDALASAGLIDAYENEWRGSKYRISPAGLRILGQQGKD